MAGRISGSHFKVWPSGAASTVSTTSEEEAPKAAVDPTLDLPQVWVTDEWAKTGPPPRGSGWWGVGSPLRMIANYNVRDLVDGGGLCSLGRWPPARRRLPDTENIGQEIYKAMRIDEDQMETFLMKMLAGKATESPFNEEKVSRGRQCLAEWCGRKGFTSKADPKDIAQPINIRLLQA